MTDGCYDHRALSLWKLSLWHLNLSRKLALRLCLKPVAANKCCQTNPQLIQPWFTSESSSPYIWSVDQNVDLNDLQFPLCLITTSANPLSPSSPCSLYVYVSFAFICSVVLNYSNTIYSCLSIRATRKFSSVCCYSNSAFSQPLSLLHPPLWKTRSRPLSYLDSWQQLPAFPCSFTDTHHGLWPLNLLCQGLWLQWPINSCKSPIHFQTRQEPWVQPPHCFCSASLL